MTTLAMDVDEHLRAMSNVSETALAAARSVGTSGSELPVPRTARLGGTGDEMLGKNILDIAQAQAETVIQPPGMPDDLGGQAAASIQLPQWNRSPDRIMPW